MLTLYREQRKKNREKRKKEDRCLKDDGRTRGRAIEDGGGCSQNKRALSPCLPSLFCKT
jgi:hypothetical protein